MDFAVFLGDEKTLIYKRGQGIVLNEPTVAAVAKDKVIAVGKTVSKYRDQDGVDFVTPIKSGRVTDTDIAAKLISQLLGKVRGSVVRAGGRYLFCIPSSLTAADLNDYKTAIYTAGVADAEFVPAVITNAIGMGYNPIDKIPVMSITAEGKTVDIAIIRQCEIIAGGTLYDPRDLEDAKKQIYASLGPDAGPLSDILHGGRISIITGAGKLLDNELVIKKIVMSN